MNTFFFFFSSFLLLFTLKMNEGLLSVKNASGRHVSLLNHAEEDSKRKYRCCEPGCNKSFTTRFVIDFILH